jgi:hypothetical protein
MYNVWMCFLYEDTLHQAVSKLRNGALKVKESLAMQKQASSNK